MVDVHEVSTWVMFVGNPSCRGYWLHRIGIVRILLFEQVFGCMFEFGHHQEQY